MKALIKTTRTFAALTMIVGLFAQSLFANGDPLKIKTSNLGADFQVVSFEAKMINDMVQLHWHINGKADIHHFELERSELDITSSKVLSPNDVPNSYNFYTYNDSVSHPEATKYTLKVVDFDGNEVSTETKAVMLTVESKILITINANDRKVELNRFSGHGQYSILDGNGTIVDEGHIKSGQVDIDISNLVKGEYFISMADEIGMKVTPLIVE